MMDTFEMTKEAAIAIGSIAKDAGDVKITKDGTVHGSIHVETADGGAFWVTSLGKIVPA